ncbi:hypothetical protein LOAG_04918 [Loa loa]|uniref:Uncharacterized protein n=1 Tax=Loa loa TaxID=7209 RepID=A0A1I7VS29_LOALO|nr:hypothetical protein LOAG_04918 [Loa loa]EFO23568.2 hypothetical protein LOAG_04918 [Loa loa]
MTIKASRFINTLMDARLFQVCSSAAYNAKMISRLIIAPSIELRMLSSPSVLGNGSRTFLFRSRLPQVDVQSPYADPTRIRVEAPDDVFITVKSPEENIALDLPNPLVGLFTKLSTFTKKLSCFGVNQKEKR